MVLFLLARRDWKLNTIKFSLVETEAGPFHKRAFLPPVANFDM